ncbi:hypothetical protein R3W88_032151 [Solanum pinnatisectum]|uniref:RNase H type-1 domain-containing protein n=1 Tax=Solanum pinnatisectum TaxID=50273 RepID=A0AAV9LRT0_9SOLN|nr:hypothetical protein R3W88_032151 [Solanum pinnatisectum]
MDRCFINISMARNYTMAEVEALHIGLCLAFSLNWGPFEIETDSTEVLQFLDHALPPYECIILRCRSLLKKLQNSLVRHSFFRQGNYVADILAKQGSIFFQSPQDYIKDQLATDKNGDISTRLIRPFMCNKLAQFGNQLAVTTSFSREYVLTNSSVIP